MTARRRRVPALLLAALLTTVDLGAAGRLEVEPRTVRAGETIQITVSLEGEAAATDSLDLQLQNVSIDSGPDTSSQFSWVNGVSRREKTFRYVGHAIDAGRASVGPVRAAGSVLPAVPITVLPPIGENVSDPEEMARLLEAAGGSSAFILAESDQEDAYVGEPIIITWSLYTDEVVSDLDVSSMPALADFWSEELPIAQEPIRSVLVGDRRMRRIPIRRVALFPLRAGELRVGSLVTSASVMRPIGRRVNPFSILNQEITTRTLRAPSRTFEVRAVPGGPYQAVGSFAMRCAPPKSSPNGPISVEVTVEGAGNLRSAAAPRFESPPDARVDLVDGGVTVDRQSSSLSMKRTWTFLLFPHRTGQLDIPPITFRAFDAARSAVASHLCGGGLVGVTALSETPTPLPSPESKSVPERRRSFLPWMLLIAALLATAAIAFRSRRRTVPRAQVDRILQHFEHPRAMRAELYGAVSNLGLDADTLLREPSERGDAFRAVQSLIDIAEKETLTGNVSRDDLRRRLRELMRAL